MVKNLGYEIELIDVETWYDAMIRRVRQSESHVLHPFLSLLEADVTEGEGLEANVHETRFDCGQTIAMLKGSAIECPEVNEKLLKAYFDYFERSGFISRGNSVGRAGEAEMVSIPSSIHDQDEAKTGETN